MTIVRSIAAPQAEGEHEHKEVSVSNEPVDITTAISTITQAAQMYSESKLPPTIKTAFKRWRPERAPDAPHDRAQLASYARCAARRL